MSWNLSILIVTSCCDPIYSKKNYFIIKVCKFEDNISKQLYWLHILLCDLFMKRLSERKYTYAHTRRISDPKLWMIKFWISQCFDRLESWFRIVKSIFAQLHSVLSAFKSLFSNKYDWNTREWVHSKCTQYISNEHGCALCSSNIENDFEKQFSTLFVWSI